MRFTSTYIDIQIFSLNIKAKAISYNVSILNAGHQGDTKNISQSGTRFKCYEIIISDVILIVYCRYALLSRANKGIVNK